MDRFARSRPLAPAGAISRLLPALVLLLVMTVAACSAGAGSRGAGSPGAGSPGAGSPGAGSPGPGGSGGPTPSGEIAAGLVVSVTEVGGLVSPDTTLQRLADIAIYQDGRVFQPGAVPAIYPGPLLPSLLQTTVSPAGLAAVLDLARQDGLADHDQAYLTPVGADMPDTIITVVVDGRAVVSRFASLGATGAAVTDPAEITARTNAQAFLSALTGYPGLLSQYLVGQSQPYVPSAVQIVARLGDPSANVEPSLLARQPVAWPLATPLAAFGTFVQPSGGPLAVERCGTVTGADLTLLWPLLANASQLTGFTSAGATWALAPTPLLPGQPDMCVGRTDQLQTAP